VVLEETAEVLLAEEGRGVADWEFVGPQIADEIRLQAHQLLADARLDFDAFERLRERGVRVYGRVNPLVCGLIGATAGYLFLVIAGPRFLPLAAAAGPGLGLTPLVLAVLVVALGVSWVLGGGGARR
jgi:hypothetical protein